MCRACRSPFASAQLADRPHTDRASALFHLSPQTSRCRFQAQGRGQPPPQSQRFLRGRSTYHAHMRFCRGRNRGNFSVVKENNAFWISNLNDYTFHFFFGRSPTFGRVGLFAVPLSLHSFAFASERLRRCYNP